MSSIDRLKIKSNRVFVPMNIDGGIVDTNFWSGYKLGIFIITLLMTFFTIMFVLDAHLGWILNLILIIGILYISTLIIRLFVLNERYHLQMYRKMKEYEVTTASVFWNIANIKDTDEGTLLVYGDLKIGVLIKLDRDTVIGKPDKYRTQHFDALSDFYKELNLKNLEFVQLSLMEQTGKDKRIPHLSEYSLKASDNPNLQKLIDAQLGYLKKVTRTTLFETDYILVYTQNTNQSEVLIREVMDCCEKLVGSSFVDLKILDKSEILSLMRENYDIQFFDFSEAVINMFNTNENGVDETVFNITGVELLNDDIREINSDMLIQINRKYKDMEKFSVLEVINNYRYTKLEKDKMSDIEVKVIDDSILQVPLELKFKDSRHQIYNSREVSDESKIVVVDNIDDIEIDF